MMKKVFSLFLATIMIIGSSSLVFAGNDNINDLDTFKQAVKTLPAISSEDFDNKSEQLIERASRDVVEQFVDEKLSLAEKKIKNYTVDLNNTTNASDYIDLGDKCYVKVTVVDIKDGAAKGDISLASTPGAETLWKDYGNRQFAVYYDVYVLLIDWQLNLSNHYTLSSTGIKVRYGDAWVNDSGVGTGSAGNVNITKSSAKVGETVSMNCIFRVSAEVDGIGISKNFKMYNKVKCSAIDTAEEQVKVVQSWNGSWI
jgi:N-methylhydantoinase B/oxoprolinase/acetone carboxylase alpha subunit